MKKMSWEKVNKDRGLIDDNNEEYEEDEDCIGQIHGVILNTITNRNPNNYEDFNFYIGHSNFYITRAIVEYLSKTEGIESLDILSPYRFRIAIGKLFLPEEILSSIEEHLIGTNNEN